MKTNKTILIIIALVAITTSDVFSQVQGRFRGGLDAGLTVPIDGLMGEIHFGYNIRHNMNVGIRGQIASLNQWNNNVRSSFNSINFMGTYTYFFGSGTIMPFVGGGFGLHYINTWVDYWGNEFRGYGRDRNNQIGGFLTTGIEFGRFRMALQYNLLPATNVSFELHDARVCCCWGQPLATANARIRNDYFAVTAGFYLGGGNRRVERLMRERDELQRELEALTRERETGMPVREREMREDANSFNAFANQHIETHINQWQQRGEFERLADWEARVSESNRQAKALELRREAQRIFIEERSNNFLVGATLGAYNPDTETFLLQTNLHGTLLLPVSIDEGQNFRNNWNNRQRIPHFVIHNDRLAFSGITFIATDGTTSRYNFPAPVEINISEQNIAVLRNQQTIPVVTPPQPVVTPPQPVVRPPQPVVTPPQPVVNVVPEREIVQVTEPIRQVETPIVTAPHDVIVLRNGDIINAQIIEITPSEIRYRPIERPHAPIIAIARRDVFSIDFADGTRQIISAPARQGRQGVSAQQGDFQQGDFAVGARLAIYPGILTPTFGIGTTIRYNITDPIRLEGTFTYFLPRNVMDFWGDGITVSMWNLGANMHRLFPVSENITLYPLTGISVIGLNVRNFGSATITGFNVGGGMDVIFNNRISFNVEPKILLLFDLTNNNTGVDFMISAGLVYRF